MSEMRRLPDLPGPFQTLQSAELDRLAAVSQVRTFAKDADIITANDEDATVFILLKGQATVSLFSADGKEVIYRTIKPGSMFGEMAAIDRLPRSAFVRARGKVILGAISAADLDVLLDEVPAIRNCVLAHLTGQMRSMTERIFELRTMLVRERLIRDILRRIEDRPQGDTISVHPMPTDTEYAAFIGSHREAVSRNLSDLKERGILTKSGRTYIIHSIVALEAELEGPFD